MVVYMDPLGYYWGIYTVQEKWIAHVFRQGFVKLVREFCSALRLRWVFLSIVNPKKLEMGLRTVSAGIPYTLLLS